MQGQDNHKDHFRAEGDTMSPSASEILLRNRLIELLQDSGIEVIDDAEEGQRVLDMANGRARQMSFGEPYDYEKYPLGRVEPGISDKKVDVIATSANHGFANYKEAKAWAKENVAKTYNPEETGDKGEVRISNGAVDKFLSQSAVDKSDSKDVHLAVLKVLPEVLKESIDVETHPDFLKGEDGKRSADNGINKDVLVHRCYGAVSIDAKLYRVKITLKEDVRNKRLPSNTHSYEATKIELLAGTLVKPEGDNPNTNNSISAANLLKNIGLSYNPSEKVLDASEKRTKSIREQRVYHGSANDFDVFDLSHMGEGEGGQAHGWGTYVTKSEGVGRKYATKSNKATGLKRSELDSNINRAEQQLPYLHGDVKAEKEKELNAWKDELSKLDDSKLLYTVEIPDDTGNNYIEEKQTLQDLNHPDMAGRIDKVMDDYLGAKDFWNSWQTPGWAMREEFIRMSMGQHPEMSRGDAERKYSELLSKAGVVGVHYNGRKDGDCYVIFDDNDLKITDKVKFFQTPNGDAYGYTLGGKIYIDPKIATAETPIHEYAHLWSEVLRKGNPEEWKNVVGLMKQETVIWDDVKKNYPHLDNDDDIADEVLATYSGRQGAKKLRALRDGIVDSEETVDNKRAALSSIERFKQLLSRIWKDITDILHIHFTSAEEVADKVMSDLLNGVNPKVQSLIAKERAEIERRAKDDGTWMKSPNGKKSNLSEDQWVTVRTQQFKDWFGDWEKDPEEASQAVDENGEPKVFYHNTDNDFTVFDANKNGTHTDAGWLGDGFYFYGDENEGNGYGHKKMEVFLNARNLYYASSVENEKLAEANNRDKSIAFRNEIEGDGYDAVYYNGDLRQEAVVFYPEQIKSATDNIGMFNAANPDIRYQKDADMKPDSEEIEAFNRLFNEELDAFKNNTSKGLLHLGSPSSILRACGVDVMELTLSPSVLHQHLKKHGLMTDDLKGLVKGLQTPILVYKHGLNVPNIVVVTELNSPKGKLSVALRLNPYGKVVEMSNISSIHGKDVTMEIDRLYTLGETLRKALRYVDKEKVSSWMMSSPYMEAGTSGNQKLFSVAKIINDFENPVKKDENLSNDPKIRFQFIGEHGTDIDNKSQITMKTPTQPLLSPLYHAMEYSRMHDGMWLLPNDKEFPVSSSPYDDLMTMFKIKANESDTHMKLMSERIQLEQSLPSSKKIYFDALSLSRKVGKSEGFRIEMYLKTLESHYDTKNDKIKYTMIPTEDLAHMPRFLVASRANDLYRAVVAATGSSSRLDRSHRDLLPDDAAAHEALVRDIAASVLMSRQGLPATLSKEVKDKLDYYERELKENPSYESTLKQDVDTTIKVIEMAVKEERVDFRDFRRSRQNAFDPHTHSIVQALATFPNAESREIVVVKDEGAGKADVILPQGASLEVWNEAPCLHKEDITEALSKQGIDNVRYFNANGSLRLRETNDYFKDKDVFLANYSKHSLNVKKSLDFTKAIRKTNDKVIEKFRCIKDDTGKYAFFLKPEGESSFSIYPTKEQRNRYFMSANEEKTDRDKIRYDISQEAYRYARDNPAEKHELIMPRVSPGIDMSRISHARLTRDARSGNTYIKAEIDGVAHTQKISNEQWSRLWLADDMKNYKISLAAHVFASVLIKSEGQVTVSAPSVQADEVRIHSDAIDNSQEQDEEEVRRPVFHL